MQIINTVLESMTNIGKPQKNLSILLSTILCMRGKVNYRNISRYCSYSEKSISRNSKKTFPFADFNSKIVDIVLSKGQKLVAALDAIFVPKSGKHTYGKDMFWNGSQSRKEKGLEASVLSLVDVDFNTAYTVETHQTPPFQDMKEGENRIDYYIKIVKDNTNILSRYVKHIVVDGYYSKKRFIDGMKECFLNVVGKLRIDSNMQHLYQGPQKLKGRRKKYNGKFDINNHRLEFSEQHEDVTLFSGILYHQSFKRAIQVVLVQKYARQVLLFSTDTNLKPIDIYLFYKSRFQIEFVFRDAKQYTGFSDCQARSKEALHFHFNANLSALNIAKVEHRLAHKKSPFSMASWKNKLFIKHLTETFFPKLGFDLTLIKTNPHYQELISYGSISKT